MRPLAIVLLATLVAGCGSSHHAARTTAQSSASTLAPIHGKYSPQIDPANFVWYAQDRQGNVWYMGELSLEREHGRFAKASDSWESGVDGAKPGIIMPGHPKPGDAYRQEYYPPGQALHQARVAALNGSVKVPYRNFKGLLVTPER